MIENKHIVFTLFADVYIQVGGGAPRKSTRGIIIIVIITAVAVVNENQKIIIQ